MFLFGRIVMIAFAVVGLFTAGLVGTLGARGKLNRESMLEFVGREGESGAGAEPAPGVDGAALAPGAGGIQETAGGDAQSRRSDAALESAANLLAASTLPRVNLPSPFSTEESAQLFEELEATRSELRGRIAAVKQQEADLQLVRSDLNRRWDELDRREQELEERAKAIVAEQSDLASRSVQLQEAERENLSNFAKKIEKMKAQAAAGLLQQKDAAEAAKILSFVKDREAAKIMEQLPPEFLSQIAAKAIGILRPNLPAAGSEEK
jgi:flagellar motility protein MotE (MotC chaperone)